MNCVLKRTPSYMIRFVLIPLLAGGWFVTSAQPISKKGEFYLPETGDYALSIDAAPFLKYIGNLFSDSVNQSPGAAFANTNFAIMGKKFVSPSKAYRASIRVNLLAENYRAFSPEFSTEPTNTTVEDVYNRTFTNVYASLGIEKRKGKTRIQGFYGLEGLLGFGTEKHTFDYGNKITTENTSPDRAAFDILFENGGPPVGNLTEEGGYIIEYKNGTTFSLGARAFVGAEVFVFPKWSIGFEYGFSAAFFYTGNSQIISEQFTIPVGGNTEQFVTTVEDGGGVSRFRIDNDNSGGALFMNFYF